MAVSLPEAGEAADCEGAASDPDDDEARVGTAGALAAAATIAASLSARVGMPRGERGGSFEPGGIVELDRSVLLVNVVR